MMLSQSIMASAQSQWRLRCKRAEDVVISCCLLILFLPILVLITLLIRITSRGPVLFRQTRVGAKCIKFQMLKFRTMQSERCTDVPFVDAGNNIWKREDDPRLTVVGRWLRRTSLDELPQLFNVLRGDMSLVGPRPLPPCMLQAPPAILQARAVQKPGITGLWQIRDRRRNTSIWHMLPHDLEYAARLSLWRDVVILLRTLRVVIGCDGAI